MTESSPSTPDNCTGYLCSYSQNFYKGEVTQKLPPTNDVPEGLAVSAATSVFNGTDKTALLYRQENFGEPHTELPPGRGMGHPGTFYMSVRFVDPHST